MRNIAAAVLAGGYIFGDYLLSITGFHLNKECFKMKNTLKILGIIALVALIGFTVIGCKKNTAGSPAADAFLNEYETFINEASSVMQQMMSGDLSVASQAGALGTKAEEMVKRWEKLKPSELSPAQMQRFEDLSDKLTRALGL